MDSYEKAVHVSPVELKDFYSSLRGVSMISEGEYNSLQKRFNVFGGKTMNDCLLGCNLTVVGSFVETLKKTRSQYYQDGIDLLKNAVSIPGILMILVTNRALKLKKDERIPNSALHDNPVIISGKSFVLSIVVRNEKCS